MAFTQIAASTNIALYDTSNPFQQLTVGVGAPGRMQVIEDQVAITRTGFGTTDNFFRLCRFPSHALIKQVELYSDLSLVDGGTSSTALVLGVAVIFSDSTIDGTPVAYQNMQPTTVGIGGGTTTPGTVVAIGGSSANVLFGTITATTGTGAFATLTGISTGSQVLYGGDITFGGTEATYYANGPYVLTSTPLVNLFNFRDGQGNLIPKLGMMDLMVYASHIYNTQPAAGYNLYGRVRYVVGS